MNEPLRLDLGNGAVLLLRENRANPGIAFRGSVRAGAAVSPPAVAEFAARAILRGTRRRTTSEVADAFEDLGAAVHTSNGDESIGVFGRCTRETLRPMLTLLVESLSEPTFAQSELAKVRGEILGDIRAQQDDTRRVATRRFLQLVYPKSHPYGRDPKGDERSVGRVDRKAVRAFHESRYVASGAIFAFSGDLDEETARSAVADAFERLPAGKPPRPVPPAADGGRSHAIARMPHKSQADVVIGRVAVPRSHPDYYALYLANLLFGRIGLYGRLGHRVRDELGLAYYSMSNLDAKLAAGHWSISAGVNPRNLAKAMTAIREEMERLESEPFTTAEIRDGKDHVVGALQVNLERNAEYAAALHDIEYYGLGADFLSRYPAIVRALKPDAVRGKAQEYFDPDACSWVASGPVGKSLAF